MDKFYLEIITPEKTFFRGEVESINIPALGGACSILAGHQPMVFATSTSGGRRKRASARKNSCAAIAVRRNIG